jgi:hypothetical protein
VICRPQVAQHVRDVLPALLSSSAFIITHSNLARADLEVQRATLVSAHLNSIVSSGPHSKKRAIALGEKLAVVDLRAIIRVEAWQGLQAQPRTSLGNARAKTVSEPKTSRPASAPPMRYTTRPALLAV